MGYYIYFWHCPPDGPPPWRDVAMLAEEFLADYRNECYLAEEEADERIASVVESIAQDGSCPDPVEPAVLDDLIRAWYFFRFGWDVALTGLGADALPASWGYRNPRPPSELGVTWWTPGLGAARHKAPYVDAPIFTSELYSRRYREAVATVQSHDVEAARLVSAAVHGRSVRPEGGRPEVADKNQYVGFLRRDEVQRVAGPVAAAAQTTELPEAKLALGALSAALRESSNAGSGLVVASI